MGKSIAKMAQTHIGKDVVISLDLSDFFPSIKQYMVKKIFTGLGLGETASIVLSELVTYKAFVPQGSITAPKLSNIISAYTFGPEIEQYCKTHNIDLTIYADDITLSYNNISDELIDKVAKANEIIAFITATVEKYKFSINKKKTKVMPGYRRQWVCGAVVNEKVNMLKKERLALRAVVHNTKKNGIEAEAAKTGMKPEKFISKYAGRINWLCQLNDEKGIELKLAFRKVAMPYLKKFPEISIPELAWNSSIEMPYVETPEDKEVFDGEVAKAETKPVKLDTPLVIS
jgi:RNA-directed DNA polymerase